MPLQQTPWNPWGTVPDDSDAVALADTYADPAVDVSPTSAPPSSKAAQSLSVLAHLADQPGSTGDFSLPRYRLSRQHELETNYANALGAGDQKAANRFGALLGILNKDIAQDPDLGIEAQQRQQAEEDRRNALRVWMDPQEKLKRQAAQNFELRKVLSAHPPQPGKPDMWGNIQSAPGLLPSADPEAPLAFGSQRMGGADPRFTDPRTGQHITPTTNATDKDQRFKDLTADLTAEQTDYTDALLNYKLEVTKGAAQKDPNIRIAMERAALIDPNWSQSEYNVRYRTQQAYAPGGADNANLNTLNTVLQHLREFDLAAKALDNYHTGFGSSVLNKAKNAWETWNEEPRQATFDAAKTAVASDIASAFQGKGAVPLEASNRWNAILRKSASPEGYKAVVDEMLDLLGGRIGQMQRNYETGTRRPFAAIRDQFINPENRAFLQGRGNSEIYNPEPNVPGVPPPPPGTPGMRPAAPSGIPGAVPGSPQAGLPGTPGGFIPDGTIANVSDGTRAIRQGGKWVPLR